MSEGTDLAKAYVQIVPSMKGVKSALSEQLGGASQEAGHKAGSNIAGMIKKTIAAAGIGMAIKKVVSSALSEGAALQQSIGGIETLFGAGGAKSVEDYADAVGKSVSEVQSQYDTLKASEQKMLTYADNAWKTAGISANEYMETSTSFAASLLSSLDGDTNAAAEAANNAVIAMADNANKMGTDMASIQNAYMGFAKGNYTMLDNLKLGYGGTKTEMEKLLADAEELSGVHYDIDNLADVYNAVSVIQDKLGITGTTAKEAATTFTGSMASMKAAAQNVLGKLALGEDITPSLNALAESVKTFLLGNFMPMLKNVFTGLPTLARQAIDLIGSVFKDLVQDAPALFSTLQELLLQVFRGIATALPGILKSLPSAISGIVDSFSDYLPSILTAGGLILQALGKGITANLPKVISSFGRLLPMVITAITNALPMLLTSGLMILKAVADGIVQALPVLIGMLPLLIESVVTFLSENLPAIIQSGVEILMTLIDGIVQAIPMLTAAIPQIIQSILTLVIANLPTIIIAGIQILNGLINGIISVLPDLIVMIPQIIQTIQTTLLSNLGVIIEGGVQILTALIDGLLSRLGTLITAGVQLVTTIWEQLKQAPAKMLAVGADVVKGIWSGISNSLTWIKNKITGWVGNVVDFIKGLFKIGSPSKLMADEIGRFLPSGISVGVDTNAYLVEDSFRELAEGIDAEATFTPALTRTLSADGLGFDNLPGAGDTEPARDAARSEEILEQILALMLELLEYYRDRKDGDGDPDALLRILDMRLGRMSAMKARGI